ncbi:DNA adenine methylase [Schinkia azotoformans]|uniref:DNA adenine methylase n=1 Tax=Schinkia azotoformans TaxID=1454 RepID=UPI002DB90624|nr:DNA adenine methylase [Schinkia azotoformans]MEC1722531.1 DNA adenine methylase [Schinkia azotoformans]MED4415867.1 DNA adenine methylase [Schinkia azotoformans]
MPKIRTNPDPLESLGSKSQVIQQLCEVAEYAISTYNIAGVQELFAGGFRFSLYLDADRELEFRTANEIDYGVASFFRCLQDPYKTDRLIEQIWLLADEYRTKDKFEEAMEERINPETQQIRAAALTYIVVVYSRAADRQTFSQHDADDGISPKSLKKLYDVDLDIGNVQIFCGDYREQFNKYKDRSDVLIYLDPPYLVTEQPKRSKSTKKKDGDERNTKVTAGYVHPFTIDDHKELVENLLTTKNIYILSGYENQVYKPLEDKEKGFYKYFLGLVKISSGKKKKEYIWTNVLLPEGLLPEEPLGEE